VGPERFGAWGSGGEVLEVLGHPWVAGELSLGHLSQRQEILGLLAHLPQAEVARADELSAFIERHALYGLGMGNVDVQLLASTRLTADAKLWTHDKRLAAAAARFDLLAPI
jgi:predicted nucleic acid-binding protein